MNKTSRLGALLTWAWWHAALIRALRTGLVIAVPYFGGSLLAEIPWLTIASAAGLGAIASLIFSIGGLAEAEGAEVSWWYAVLERVVKSFIQALGVGIGQATLFEQVDWALALQASVIAGLGSLVLAFITKLPEAPILPSAITITTSAAEVSVTPTSSGDTVALATLETVQH